MRHLCPHVIKGAQETLNVYFAYLYKIITHIKRSGGGEPRDEASTKVQTLGVLQVCRLCSILWRSMCTVGAACSLVVNMIT